MICRVVFTMTASDRVLCKCGISIPSASNCCPVIDKDKYLEPMFGDVGQALIKAWICRTVDSCNFAPYLQMHVMNVVASASATTVAAIRIAQNARDINVKNKF